MCEYTHKFGRNFYDCSNFNRKMSELVEEIFNFPTDILYFVCITTRPSAILQLRALLIVLFDILLDFHI